MLVRLTLALALLVAVLATGVLYLVVTSDLWLDRTRRHLDLPGWTHEKFTDELLAYHHRLDAGLPTGMALFFGDSLTQSLCVSCVASGAVNFGIGGDTTEGLLGRLPGYRSPRIARVSVIAIGINDLRSRSPSEIAETYGRILGHFPEASRLVVSAVLPVDQTKAGDQRPNGAIKDLNARLATLCVERDHCEFVDVGHALGDEGGRLDSAFHVGDGIHLNAAGYAIWTDSLRAGLSRLDVTGDVDLVSSGNLFEEDLR